MLLTLSAPKPEFELKAHDRSSIHHSYSASSGSRRSPKNHRASLPPFTELDSPTHNMSQTHRGLPPLTLPEPGRGQPMMSQQTGPGPGQMPAPPSQWQGAEESMRNWLLAKAEEDKRRQEEERTRQESLRLEQRKIEQSMLRDSMKGGVPPHLVPMIFAGISGSGSGSGGGSYSHLSQDWLLQYSTQLQGAQHQASQVSSDQRDSRPGGTGHQQITYGMTGQAPALAGLVSQPQSSGSISGPSYRRKRSPSGTMKVSPSAMSSSSIRQATPASLPKLMTNERQYQQSTSGQPGIQVIQQVQPSQQAGSTSATPASQTEQQSTSTPIFYHYTPRTSQGASTGGTATSSGPSDYMASPKKRRAQGSRNPTPARSSARQYKSPSFSHAPSSASTAGRKGGHSRDRSDASVHVYDGSSSAARPSRRGTFSAGVPEEPSSAPAESHARGSSPPEALQTQKHSTRRHTRSDEDYQHRRYREKSGASASLSSSQHGEGQELHYEEKDQKR